MLGLTRGSTIGSLLNVSDSHWIICYTVSDLEDIFYMTGFFSVLEPSLRDKQLH